MEPGKSAEDESRQTSEGGVSKEIGIPNEDKEKKTELLLKNSVIKGFHAYKFQPPNREYYVDPEENNPHDSQACLVWVPPEDNNPANERQTVGHVPRGLAPAFRKIINSFNSIILAIPTGSAKDSFPPWPSKSDTGGGEVIPCNYKITTGNSQEVISEINQALSAMPEGSSMTIETVQSNNE